MQAFFEALMILHRGTIKPEHLGSQMAPWDTSFLDKKRLYDSRLIFHIKRT